MKILSLGLCCCIALSSCRWLVHTRYHMHRTHAFANREAYLQQIKQENIIPVSQLLYIQKEALPLFYQEVIKPVGTIVYLGTYRNDSLRMKCSASLETNESCWGRIEKEILEQLAIIHPADSIWCQTASLSTYSLHYLSTNQFFHPVANNKWTIYLLYSHSLGSYYHALYQSILGLQRKYSNKLDVFIITLDPINTQP